MVNLFLNLIRSMRLERTIHISAIMLIPVAFASHINLEVIFLMLSSVLLYGGFSIHNAIKDDDYELPSYSKLVMYLMIGSSLGFGFISYINMISILLWIALGYLYNGYSRKILFADISFLTLANFVLPIISSALVLKVDMRTIIIVSVLSYISLWFFSNLKNLNGFEDDKKRGYKTIATEFNNFKPLVKIFFDMGVLFSFIIYLVLPMSQLYLVGMVFFLILKVLVFICLDFNQLNLSLRILRTMIIVLTSAFLLGNVPSLYVVALPLIFLSSIFWLKDMFVVLRTNSIFIR